MIFAGTPEFALASLRALVDAGVRPVAVMTQPDRPAGRGRRLTGSPVKRYARSRDLPLLQPASLRDPDVVTELRELAPDIMIVAAYGLILPQAVLDVPAQGCVNVHASLLPRWRGAAPIQAAILAGDRESGVSLMKMDAGLDSGPVYCRAAVPITPGMTAGELHDELASLGGRLLVENLDAILEGRLVAEPQDERLVTYAAKIRKADARIDWKRPAVELQRIIHAYNPVPGASFEFGDERIKCWRATVGHAEEGPPGQVLAAGEKGIEVACGEGSLILTEVQRPGRRHVTATELAGQLDLDQCRFH